MSLDIRYITNGVKTIYRVIDGSAESFNIYNDRDDIPKSIRHYAPKGEPKFVGPDMATIFGVRDILYPNFPNCGLPDYVGRRCIAESCKFADDLIHGQISTDNVAEVVVREYRSYVIRQFLK